VIGDPYQGMGLGTEIVKRLLDVARREGITRITSSMAPDNAGMLRICEKLGFRRMAGVAPTGAPESAGTAGAGSAVAQDDGLVHVEYGANA
jgi:GNAT superfamily N-acetyltransferase